LEQFIKTAGIKESQKEKQNNEGRGTSKKGFAVIFEYNIRLKMRTNYDILKSKEKF
jgi:hypothetical protein